MSKPARKAPRPARAARTPLPGGHRFGGPPGGSGLSGQPVRARAGRPSFGHVLGGPPGGSGAPVRAKPAPRAAKARGLALGEAVACCAAEALAASLRLAGGSVSDSDVLALHWLAGGGADAGVPILAALEAAAEHGLSGVRPVSFGPVDLDAPAKRNRGFFSPVLDLEAVMPHGPMAATQPETRAGLILGADLPGSHALCDDGTWWWSWGEPYDPADFSQAVIEEAWALCWEPG